MHYVDIGQGEVLVLLHGLGSTKESWKPQQLLSSHYRLIIPDLRGHGASTIQDNFTIEQFAQDILQLLDRLGIASAHFCGISLGGVIVQEIYRQQPTRVRSLILSNTFSHVPLLAQRFAATQTAKMMETHTEAEIADFITKKCVYQQHSLLLDDVHKTLTIHKEPYLATATNAVKQNYLHLLPFIYVPVMVIGSTHDEVIPLSTVAQTVRWLSFPQVHIFPFCGHLPNMEEPEQFNQLINHFLSTQTLFSLYN